MNPNPNLVEDGERDGERRDGVGHVDDAGDATLARARREEQVDLLLVGVRVRVRVTLSLSLSLSLSGEQQVRGRWGEHTSVYPNCARYLMQLRTARLYARVASR